MALDPLVPSSGNQNTSPWNPKTGIADAYPTLGAVPAQTEVSTANFNPATQGTATAATRQLEDGELTSNNITGLIGADSPLMQQASSRALQQANSRGLLNSSMAVGAAQGAVMDRALPIAQADSVARTNVLNTNQANTQQTNVFNAGQTQDMNKFNATTDLQSQQFNAGEANKSSIVNASESNKILSQLMDSQNKLYLADIEASYKNVMQSQASAMTLYQQSVKNISDILMDPDLTPAAKTAAVANQNQMLETGMKILGKIGGLELDELLVFPSA
jgi:hypothetical protein